MARSGFFSEAVLPSQCGGGCGVFAVFCCFFFLFSFFSFFFIADSAFFLLKRFFLQKNFSWKKRLARSMIMGFLIKTLAYYLMIFSEIWAFFPLDGWVGIIFLFFSFFFFFFLFFFFSFFSSLPFLPSFSFFLRCFLCHFIQYSLGGPAHNQTRPPHFFFFHRRVFLQRFPIFAIVRKSAEFLSPPGEKGALFRDFSLSHAAKKKSPKKNQEN